jgi:hypothetical protein
MSLSSTRGNHKSPIAQSSDVSGERGDAPQTTRVNVQEDHFHSGGARRGLAHPHTGVGADDLKWLR